MPPLLGLFWIAIGHFYGLKWGCRSDSLRYHRNTVRQGYCHTCLAMLCVLLRDIFFGGLWPEHRGFFLPGLVGDLFFWRSRIAGCLFSTRKGRSEVPERGDLGKKNSQRGKAGVDREKQAQKDAGRPIFIQCGCWRELCSPYRNHPSPPPSRKNRKYPKRPPSLGFTERGVTMTIFVLLFPSTQTLQNKGKRKMTNRPCFTPPPTPPTLSLFSMETTSPPPAQMPPLFSLREAKPGGFQTRVFSH